MEEEEKRIYGEIANVMIKQGYGMHNDMITALQKTSGNISYKQIANYIGGLVTEKTIAKHLKTLKGYQIVKSRILPRLAENNVMEQVVFCESFFIFWHSENIQTVK